MLVTLLVGWLDFLVCLIISVTVQLFLKSNLR